MGAKNADEVLSSEKERIQRQKIWSLKKLQNLMDLKIETCISSNF